MIVTFTDFGSDGPYMGQMRAVLRTGAPDQDVIDLMVDAPAFNPRAASYLLAAVLEPLREALVCVAVVDPGVGGARRPVILRCGERWFVGPDNGLLEIVARHFGGQPEWWEITWRPARLSASFHGRDLFAPVAARLAREGAEGIAELAAPLSQAPLGYSDWPDDLAEVIYIDGYGNCMLGIRWGQMAADATVMTGAVTLATGTTFSDVSPGEAFCYENAMGLAEIAVNQGNAARQLGLKIGSQVDVRELSGK
ncbi:MAG: SAM-dependent chlorinase/fluorinase [Rhodospirillales bacterium]|nr:SAM-dependent chlorinase/fluorinase [Rhodospirillales bacterium]MBO6787007.1 SAM-dependent chlorinase/fluorinase [Rhodospirillales bacterium]